jgi:hypothetical protein
MTLLTPSERVTLERIRGDGTASPDGLALAIRRGWAERAGNAKHKLTDAGHAALAGDEADRVSSRSAHRPGRARNRHE